MKINILIFITVLVVGAAGIVYVAFPETTSFLSTANTEEQEQEKEKEQNTGDESPDYTVTPIPIPDEITIPNIDKQVEFSESVPEELRTIIANKIDSLKIILREDSENAGAWYDLALYYHNANDYEAAREVWEFLVEAAPDDTTAYENLAKLYHFYLKDFPQSESYFNQSLSIEPNSVNPYLGLFELYRYSYKTETTAAADIMNQAIALFPDQLGLVYTLGVYYKEQGNIPHARTALEDGLNKARDVGDVDMIAAFGKELDRLPQ